MREKQQQGKFVFQNMFILESFSFIAYVCVCISMYVCICVQVYPSCVVCISMLAKYCVIFWKICIDIDGKDVFSSCFFFFIHEGLFDLEQYGKYVCMMVDKVS